MKCKQLLSLLLLLGVLLSLLLGSVYAAETRKPSVTADATFFAKLNLNASGLSKVKSAVSAGNYTLAKTELLNYYKSTFATYNPEPSTPVVGSMRELAMEDSFAFQETHVTYKDIAYDANTFTQYAFPKAKELSGNYVLSSLEKTTNIIEIVSSNHADTAKRPVLRCLDASNNVLATLSPSDDTYISYGSPDTTYADSTYLYVKDSYSDMGNGTYLPYGTTTRRTYIKFDMSKMPSNTKYTQLVIYAHVEGDGSETTIRLRQFAAYCKTWTESTLTWNYLINNSAISHFSWKGVPGGFDWKKPAGTPSEWLNSNTRFTEISTLIQTSLTKTDTASRDAYIQQAKKLLLDFINDVNVTNGWPSKRDIESANRLMEFPYIYKQILSYTNLTAEENKLILAWLYDEMIYMDGGANIFSNTTAAHNPLVYTNRGLWHLAGLYCGAMYWPEFANAAAWKTRFDGRVDAVLDNLILEDGAYNEITFSYPANVISWCTYLQYCLQERKDTSNVAAKIDQKLILLANYLIQCAQPNGITPNWGQGGAREIAPTVQELLDNLGTKYDSDSRVQYLRFFLDRTKGKVPPTTSQFEGNKLVIDRTGWNTDDSMIFMNAKAAGNHSHRDALSLLFHFGGRDLLIDTGMTTYDGNSPHFWFQNSTTRSHNTIEVDGKAQTWQQNYSDAAHMGDIAIHSTTSAAAITSWTTANDKDLSTKSLSADGKTVNNADKHTADFTHYRNVSFLKRLGDILIVTDKVVPSDTATHSYTQNWHSAPYSNASIANDNYDTGKTAFSTGANLTIAQASSNSISASLKSGYDASAASGTTKYFEYKQSASGTVTYQTVLYPTLAGQTVTVQPTKLTMSSTNDATARAMKVAITDSVNTGLKTLYYYNSFESTPTKRAFDTYTTNASIAAIALDGSSKRTFATMSNGSLLSVTSGNTPILQFSAAVTDVSAYVEGTSLYLESSDHNISKLSFKANMGVAVTKVYLNGESVEFTIDSANTVSVDNGYIILHFNESSLLNTTASWTPTRSTVNIDKTKGILYGNINDFDPCLVSANNAVSYIVKEGDVIEMRINLTNSTTVSGSQIFFQTAEEASWGESKSVRFTTPINAGYQTVTGAIPTAQIGKTITCLRIDPLNTNSSQSSTGTYEIDYVYVGPAEYAPSKQTNKLYFDFSNMQADVNRYQSPIYNGRNYDEGCWATNGTRTEVPIYNNAEGTVSLLYKEGGSGAYMQTSYNAASTSTSVLQYKPNSDDVMDVRVKFENCVVTSGASPVLRMYFLRDGSSSVGNSDYVQVAINKEDITSGQYINLRAFMNDNFKNANVSAIRPCFVNVVSAEGKLGRITFDYIFIGSQKELPSGPAAPGLFFDFKGDTDRYANATYGNLDFDTSKYWYYRQSSMQATQVNTSSGTLSVSLIANNTSADHYIQTSGSATKATAPLHYRPSRGDYFQMRLKVDNATLFDTSKPLSLGLYYTNGSKWFDQLINVNSNVLGNGYFTVTIPLDSNFYNSAEIQALRPWFSNLNNASGKTASITIDYIYIGQAESMPIQDSVYFGFTNTFDDALRYNNFTYCYKNYDLAATWKGRTSSYTDGTATVSSGALVVKPGESSFTSIYADSANSGLHFNADNAEFFQIRFKMTGFSGTLGRATIHFYPKTNSTYENSLVNTAVSFDASYLNSGKYITVTGAVDQAVRDFAGEFERIVLHLSAFNDPGNTNGTLTIDYAYIGPKAGLPTPAYSVKFVDASGKTLNSQYVTKGESAFYNGTTPTKAYDSTNHYTFKAWDKALTNITADTTITATYTATAHSYSYTKVDATNHKASCTCGYSKNAAHTWNSGSVTTQPTCTAAGVKTFTCSACKQTKTEAVAALGHNWGNWKSVDNDTHKRTCQRSGCTASESESHVAQMGWEFINIGSATHHDRACRFCEHVRTMTHSEHLTYTDNNNGTHTASCRHCLYSASSVHNYTSEVTKQPTCTETGLKTYTCTECKSTKTEAIAAKGHTEVIDKAIAPTCTTAGKTEGKHCSVCSTVIKAQTTVAALGHKWDSGKVTTNATCTTDGVKTYTCQNDSSHTKTETIVKLGHSYTTKVTAPTCTAQGYTTHTCSRCSDSYKDTYVAAKGHTEVIDKAVAATCTATGLTEGKHCSVCNEVIIAQEEIAALGHTEVIDEAVAATCTSYGKTEGKHCSVCNETIVAQEMISPLDHVPSYTDNGNKTHTVGCENCDYSEIVSCTFENGECICGAKEVVAPIYDEAVKFSHSLTLENDISINFIGLGSALIGYDSFYLECKVPVYNGNELVGYETVTIEPVYNGKNYECTLLGITAKMMNDEIEAVFHMTKDGQEYYSRTDVYSVAEYAYGKLDSIKATDTAELKAICANLLRYGSMAQVQFNYRTDALVDTAMTDAHKAFLTDLSTVEMKDYRKQLSDLDIVIAPWKSTTLELGNKVIMCLIANLANYSGDPSELTMRLSYTDAKGVAVTEERPLALYNPEALTYAVSYDGLRATEMRSVVSAAIYRNGERVSKTVEYSIESYGARSKDPAMQDLCRAMLAYGDAANAFFAN